ncbi:L-arabinose isomerase, partial [bacterium]|nr:L-arabinose isomerase [bacterium]
MIDLKQYEIWYVTGSQLMYGPKTLELVAQDSLVISSAFNQSIHIPVKVVFKPVLTSPETILDLCQQANSSANCIGLVIWMHTFSPAQMWLGGLGILKKPWVHLHTHFIREIPWSEID